jgi:hypothetical protein
MNDLLELKMFLEMNLDRIRDRIEELNIEELKINDVRLQFNYYTGKSDATYFCIELINHILRGKKLINE